MTEAERRRQQLLKSARMSERSQGMPAIHPRYRAAYRSLYGDEEEAALAGGTFSIRVVLCILLFALFVIGDYKNTTVLTVNSSELVRQIQEEPEAVTTFLNKVTAAGFLDK